MLTWGATVHRAKQAAQKLGEDSGVEIVDLRTISPWDRDIVAESVRLGFATATVFQRKWGWKAGVPAYLVATFVGVTRLENVHYLSDVTFGAAVGVASGLAIKLPGPRVEPILAPGVVGVSFRIGSPRS